MLSVQLQSSHSVLFGLTKIYLAPFQKSSNRPARQREPFLDVVRMVAVQNVQTAGGCFSTNIKT